MNQTEGTPTDSFSFPSSGGKKEEAVAEALIRQRVEDYAKAIRGS